MADPLDSVGTGGRDGADESGIRNDSPASARPEGTNSWAGLEATASQAMEWGIELAGQLASVHESGSVVGSIRADTIGQDEFGRPSLPEPDPRVDHDPWVDVAALAAALRSIVPDPSPEFVDALRPPYASAVALGQELQDAQEAMGLPVAPIPFAGAPPSRLGGFPVEVPPDDLVMRLVGPVPEPEVPDPLALPPAHPIGSERPADPEPAPDWRILLAVALVVAVVAVALGIGWS